MAAQFIFMSLIFVVLVFGPMTGCNYSVDKVAHNGGATEKTKSPAEGGSDDSSEADPMAPKFSEIHPILIAQCLGCHSDKRQVASLSVESWTAMVENPRAVIPGDAENSGIYASVTDDYMPDRSWVSRGLVRPLKPEEKESLRKWIDAGAPNN